MTARAVEQARLDAMQAHLDEVIKGVAGSGKTSIALHRLALIHTGEPSTFIGGAGKRPRH